MAHQNQNAIDDSYLEFIPGSSHHLTASDRDLFLFAGDATKGRISAIIPAEGVNFPPSIRQDREKDFQLTIYHINDLHGHLSIIADEHEEPVISRIGGEIKKKQQKVFYNPDRAVLTISAGDDLIGGAFDILLDEMLTKNPIHASYRFYSSIGLDLAALGNHDLDFGIDSLIASIKRDAKFPILAANLANTHLFNGNVFPAAMLIIKGIRIGVIGLTTSAETKLSHEGIHILNPVPIARELVNAIKPLCDVIILLTHLGKNLGVISAVTADAGDEELARSLPSKDVHLIVGGHSHDLLNPSGLSSQNIVNGIPIVQAGSMGNYLGRVDLRIGREHVAVTHANLLPAKTLPVDKDLEKKFVTPLLNRTRKLFSTDIGLVENDPTFSTDYVKNFYAAGELALANFITDGLVNQLNMAGQMVDLALLDSSSIQCGLDLKAKMTVGDWFKLMPYSDTIRFYQMNGRELSSLLQDNAYRIDRPDEPNTERGFLHFSSSLHYKISLGSQRCEAKVFDVFLSGEEIKHQFDNKIIVAATNFVRELSKTWEQNVDLAKGCDLLDINQYTYVETDYFFRRKLIQYVMDIGGVTHKTGAKLDGRLIVLHNG